MNANFVEIKQKIETWNALNDGPHTAALIIALGRNDVQTGIRVYKIMEEQRAAVTDYPGISGEAIAKAARAMRLTQSDLYRLLYYEHDIMLRVTNGKIKAYGHLTARYLLACYLHNLGKLSGVKPGRLKEIIAGLMREQGILKQCRADDIKEYMKRAGDVDLCAFYKNRRDILGLLLSDSNPFEASKHFLRIIGNDNPATWRDLVYPPCWRCYMPNAKQFEADKQRREILRLQRGGIDKSETARRLKISRPTLYKRLKEIKNIPS